MALNIDCDKQANADEIQFSYNWIMSEISCHLKEVLFILTYGIFHVRLLIIIDAFFEGNFIPNHLNLGLSFNY